MTLAIASMRLTLFGEVPDLPVAVTLKAAFASRTDACPRHRGSNYAVRRIASTRWPGIGWPFGGNSCPQPAHVTSTRLRWHTNIIWTAITESTLGKRCGSLGDVPNDVRSEPLLGATKGRACAAASHQLRFSARRHQGSVR